MSQIKTFIKNIIPLNNRTEMPAILYVLKVILIFFFCKFGAEVICEGIVLGIHFACGLNPLKGEMFGYYTITLITYLGYSVMIALFFLYWKVIQKKSLSDLGFNKMKIGTYLIGAVAAVVLLALCVVPVVLCDAITYHGVFSTIDTKMVALMLLCFVFQGAMEEVLCRGIAQQLLQEKVSVPVAIAVSTALFTIPHIQNMSGESASIVALAVTNLILISILFSLFTLRFKSIWAACGLHAIWNYVLFNILGLNLSGKDEMVCAVFDMRSVGNSIFNGGQYGIEASVVTAVVLAAAIAVMYFLRQPSEVREAK